MTPDDVRWIALNLPETAEGAHGGHPDFRVAGKVFASLQPVAGHAVVKLSAEQQEMLVGAEPKVFAPAAGAWGRQGWTVVTLEAADVATLRGALIAGWRNVAPRRLLSQLAAG